MEEALGDSHFHFLPRWSVVHLDDNIPSGFALTGLNLMLAAVLLSPPGTQISAQEHAFLSDNEPVFQLFSFRANYIFPKLDSRKGDHPGKSQ